MTPAGTSNELDVQNEWEENTTHTVGGLHLHLDNTAVQKILGPTLMHTKNLYENGPNPYLFFGTKNMSEGHLMLKVLVCYVFDNLGQACLCG